MEPNNEHIFFEPSPPRKKMLITVIKCMKDIFPIMSGLLNTAPLLVMSFFIQTGTNIHEDDDNALRIHAAHGNEAIVRFLVDNGADIHANDDQALKRAMDNGHISHQQELE